MITRGQGGEVHSQMPSILKILGKWSEPKAKQTLHCHRITYLKVCLASTTNSTGAMQTVNLLGLRLYIYCLKIQATEKHSKGYMY